MNEQLEAFARAELKKGLASCTDGQVGVFRRMYSHLDLGRPVDEIVDGMPVGKLDVAMDQVQGTIAKNDRRSQASVEAHE